MVEFYELLALVVSLIVVTLFHWIYQWRNPKTNGKLPPGSMGFPIIGDTFEFMKPHDVLQFPTFIKERVLRYGPVFRTSLFGSKAIISLDFELNLEIAKANHVPGITKSISRLFGKNNLFIQSKQSHKHVRNLTFQLLGPKYLKLKMVQDVDVLARTYMEEGARNGCLDVKETSSKILIECLAKKVMGEMEPEAAKELALCWRYFPRDWFQFSWNIPGTGVYRMMKARKRMMKLIKETVLKKRASGEEFGEFFKIIFGEMEGGAEKMSVENAIEYIYTFFLIANETTPGILAATIKLISDHPNVMQELQREHDRIVQGKPEKEAGLTWEDYKSMTFTQMVIYESLRITSTAPTVLRMTDHDFQVGDYTIPAGWIFMGYANVHFNPEKYDDPLAFDPWRWKSEDLGSILSKSYIAFGAGSRLCVGAEFAKLQMAIFIHHLFRYRWSMKKETTVLRRFMLMFPCGSDVQFSYDTKVDNSVGYRS
ncbi:PREDICTED: cytochrome P450 708A2-like [Camelina sativa]|uniref:Cytochrome P450 708A2-like n=1 Tax=Camelina sativa TaxID=90675 RepID=A0ABM1QRM0_CAMSA|nr:PREDICTED: cytochrome P450 708A2-like [Camelina sativa]